MPLAIKRGCERLSAVLALAELAAAKLQLPLIGKRQVCEFILGFSAHRLHVVVRNVLSLDVSKVVESSARWIECKRNVALRSVAKLR